MQDFRNLTVWARAHELTLSIYRVTRTFPREELFGLTAQMRRAAMSTAGNIAEGCGRGSDREFRRFLHIALGSASELEYYLVLTRDLDLISVEAARKLTMQVIEVKRMLASLIKALAGTRKAARTQVLQAES